MSAVSTKTHSSQRTAELDPILNELIRHFGGAENVGKESHTFRLNDFLLLIYTSDTQNKVNRREVNYLPDRGAAVTALRDHASREILEPAGITHDLVVTGNSVTQYYHDHFTASMIRNPELQKRVMIVHRLEPLPFKCVARVVAIEGTNTSEVRLGFYKKPERSGSRKDEPMETAEVLRAHPTIEDEFRKLFNAIASHARLRGQRLEDLTCRAAYGSHGEIQWIEKVGVRAKFVLEKDKTDFSIIRDALYDPERRGKTASRVQRAFKLRTGRTLSEYQTRHMGIRP